MASDILLLIADDHPIFRQGLRRIIESDARLRVVSEAGDGEVAIQNLAVCGVRIAILDIDMPRYDGFEVARAIRSNGWAVEVIFLTMHKDERFLNAALELGVKGYVLKDSAATEIVDCIHSVAEGREYISPQLSSILIKRLRGEAAGSAAGHLTSAEREVMRRVAAYKTSKEIAEELFISIRTVEHHRGNIGQKLSLKGSHALLRFALEHKDEF
jgi:DNA-binding NarL/FixJ family response regulator